MEICLIIHLNGHGGRELIDPKDPHRNRQRKSANNEISHKTPTSLRLGEDDPRQTPKYDRGVPSTGV